MKKLFLLAVVSAVLLHSCSGDREEEVITPKPEKTSKKELKLNNSIQKVDFEELTLQSDSIRILNSADANELPADGGDPTTITPPHR